jgi:Reverse transcriptase (RNA-dependent DNA polymerase)
MPWPLKESDLKRYPHFDAHIPLAELQKLATDPTAVRRHAFFPFLHYEKRWRPFRRAADPPKRKIRPIRYASRRDSAIFSYYRHLLSEPYEAELTCRGIESCPIAYRKLRRHDSSRGKCNIDFAADAFHRVRDLANCCAVTLDVSGFFDNIDHDKLRSAWCHLLQVQELPADHRSVFKSITRYAVVDRIAVYERLGFIGDKIGRNGRISKGYLKPRRDMPIQLCSPSDFREKICGADAQYSSLISTNKNAYGIPQGAPISDLLANVYLLDFDQLMGEYAHSRSGAYFRYSDDIFILVPGDEKAGRDAEAFATAAIHKSGDQLEIKASKTSIVTFAKTSGGGLLASRIDKPASTGGLEYLGFRFDGIRVYIRESTMSKFHRGIRLAARRRAIQLVRRYRGKTFDFLLHQFNISAFEARFGRVAEFERTLAHRKWTFRTYVKRCVEVFGPSGDNFFGQTRNHKRFLRDAASAALRTALAKQTVARNPLNKMDVEPQSPWES